MSSNFWLQFSENLRTLEEEVCLSPPRAVLNHQQLLHSFRSKRITLLILVEKFVLFFAVFSPSDGRENVCASTWKGIEDR